MTDVWTIQRAAEEALRIYTGGPVNLTAVLYSMHQIGRAYLRYGQGTDAANTSAPMKLAMVQATWMATGQHLLTTVEVDALMTECERLAKG
jgi:hypothetical protein